MSSFLPVCPADCTHSSCYLTKIIRDKKLNLIPSSDGLDSYFIINLKKSRLESTQEGQRIPDKIHSLNGTVLTVGSTSERSSLGVPVEYSIRQSSEIDEANARALFIVGPDGRHWCRPCCIDNPYDPTKVQTYAPKAGGGYSRHLTPATVLPGTFQVLDTPVNSARAM